LAGPFDGQRFVKVCVLTADTYQLVRRNPLSEGTNRKSRQVQMCAAV